MCRNLLQFTRLSAFYDDLVASSVMCDLHMQPASKGKGQGDRMCGSQDRRIAGSQDHRVLCKYLASTFWRAKINLQAVGYIRRVCLRFTVCFLSACHVCVCVLRSATHVTQEKEREGEGEGGREKHLPLVADQVVGRSSSHAPTGYTNSYLHTFIHSFILSALIRRAEFTGIRSGSEDQDVLRALFEYFSSTIRGENLKDIRPENSHVHFAYITIALPYATSLPFSLPLSVLLLGANFIFCGIPCRVFGFLLF